MRVRHVGYHLDGCVGEIVSKRYVDSRGRGFLKAALACVDGGGVLCVFPMCV